MEGGSGLLKAASPLGMLASSGVAGKTAETELGAGVSSGVGSGVSSGVSSGVDGFRESLADAGFVGGGDGTGLQAELRGLSTAALPAASRTSSVGGPVRAEATLIAGSGRESGLGSAASLAAGLGDAVGEAVSLAAGLGDAVGEAGGAVAGKAQEGRFLGGREAVDEGTETSGRQTSGAGNGGPAGLAASRRAASAPAASAPAASGRAALWKPGAEVGGRNGELGEGELGADGCFRSAGRGIGQYDEG